MVRGIRENPPCTPGRTIVQPLAELTPPPPPWRLSPACSNLPAVSRMLARRAPSPPAASPTILCAPSAQRADCNRNTAATSRQAACGPSCSAASYSRICRRSSDQRRGCGVLLAPVAFDGRGRLELDDVRAVVLRAVDHNSIHPDSRCLGFLLPHSSSSRFTAGASAVTSSFTPCR